MLIALVIALAIVAWWPFDPTLDVSTLAARWRATERDPWMIDGVTAGVQALLYAWLSLAVAVCSYRAQGNVRGCRGCHYSRRGH